MTSPPDGPRAGSGIPAGERIAKRLRTVWLGRPLIALGQTDSTMARAKALLAEGPRRGRVVVAESQTEGRGRGGRPFVSPRGGLYLTAELEPLDPAGESWRLGLCAALAVRSAVTRLGGPELTLSWPNDLYHGHRKVAGILVELTSAQSVAVRALVGVGVNVETAPRELESPMAGPAGTLPRLHDPDPVVSLAALVLLELEELDSKVRRSGGWEDVLESVRHALRGMIGQTLSVRTPSGDIVRGRCVGMAADGALLLGIAGDRIVPVHHGDVDPA